MNGGNLELILNSTFINNYVRFHTDCISQDKSHFEIRWEEII